MSALKFNLVFEDAGDGWLYAITMVLDERRARAEVIPKPGWAPVESVEIAA